MNINDILFGLGESPLPPQRDTLEGHTPNLQGLSRDDLGIINQLQDNNTLDGGDSAHRTGVAAFCNSSKDQQLLSLFEHDGIMLRHPSQVPWNNWKNCTRDQLIGYASGCWRAGFFDITQRLLHAHETRFPPFTCQDTEKDYPGTTKSPPIGDPLGPHDIMFLKICAGENGAFRDTAAQLFLAGSILQTNKDLTVDNNNLLIRSIVCGRLDLFVQVMPNYEEMIRYYWSGRRKQPQIAEELVWVTKKELARYPVH